MTKIKALLIANTKALGKVGDEVEVSAADLARYPHIFRAKSDVDAEAARQQAQAPKSAQDWHQEQRTLLRQEQVRVEEQRAILAMEKSEMEKRRAEAAAERARILAEENIRAQELAVLRAENERLMKLQAQHDASANALSELKPSPPAAPGTPAPEAPAEPAQPTTSPKPHERKRDR